MSSRPLARLPLQCVGSVFSHLGDGLENDGNSNPKCGDLHSMDSSPSKSFRCIPAMKGRYVNIRLQGAGKILTLCEVIINPNPTGDDA